MKDELVALIVKKVGLTQEQAVMVVDVMVDFLKKKMPAIGSQLEMLMNADIDLTAAANLIGGLVEGAKKKKGKK